MHVSPKNPASISTLTEPSTSRSLSTTLSTGLKIIVRSVFGLAFYDSSGKITIQPASLFLNMTAKGSNFTGIIFSIDSGRISIGISNSLRSEGLHRSLRPSLPRILWPTDNPGSDDGSWPNTSSQQPVPAVPDRTFPARIAPVPE